MLVSFKNISNKVIKYNVNFDDNLSSIVPKLLEYNKNDPVEKSIKFIFQGQILNHEMLFSDFIEENIVIIFMISKIKTISSTSINYNIQTPQLNNIQPLPNIFNQLDNYESDDTLDSIDKLRAGVIGSLVFIRTNPHLAELFNNNFETLVYIMTSNQIRPLFEKMISENVNGDSGYLDDLSELLININSK